jgi:hypothetical protein
MCLKTRSTPSHRNDWLRDSRDARGGIEALPLAHVVPERIRQELPYMQAYQVPPLAPAHPSGG